MTETITDFIDNELWETCELSGYQSLCLITDTVTMGDDGNKERPFFATISGNYMDAKLKQIYRGNCEASMKRAVNTYLNKKGF